MSGHEPVRPTSGRDSAPCAPLDLVHALHGLSVADTGPGYPKRRGGGSFSGVREDNGWQGPVYVSLSAQLSARCDDEASARRQHEDTDDPQGQAKSTGKPPRGGFPAGGQARDDQSIKDTGDAPSQGNSWSSERLLRHDLQLLPPRGHPISASCPPLAASRTGKRTVPITRSCACGHPSRASLLTSSSSTARIARVGP